MSNKKTKGSTSTGRLHFSRNRIVIGIAMLIAAVFLTFFYLQKLSELPSKSLPTPSQVSEDSAEASSLWGGVPLSEDNMIISVSLQSLASSVSGQIRADDIIRFYAVDGAGAAYTPGELEFIRVASTHTAAGEDSSKTGELPASVSIYVNQDQALKVAELERSGQIYLSLVHREDLKGVGDE